MPTKFYRTFLIISLVLLLLFSAASAQAEEASQPVSFKTRPMAEQEHTYELVVNDQIVLRYRSMSQGMDAAQRAALILERVKELGPQLVEGPITTGVINGAHVITVREKLLITVTQSDFEANNSTGEGLAQVWAGNLQAALHLEKDGDPAPLSEAGAAEQKMLELVNKERAQAGAKPLAMDNELVRIARLKSADMIENKYFDHTSPRYGDPFTMLQSFGIKYKLAGENLAGDQTVEKAHQALMNSPGHRKNILNPGYTHIGIGIVEGGPYGAIFTQLFIGK